MKTFAWAGLCLAVVAMHGPAAAHGPGKATPTDPQAAATRAPGGAPQSFDWLAKRAPAADRTAPRSQSIPGRGAYVCSAAGFGEMSHCTER